MIRLTKLMSVKALVKYHEEELRDGVSEYYTKEKGIWIGQIAQRLGLPPEVTKEDFIAVMSNQVPGSSGKRLTARANGKTKQMGWEWDEEQQTTVQVEIEKSNHRCGNDITVSVTKEESLLAIKDKFYVAKVQMVALREVMEKMERDTQVRIRKGGAQDNRTSGEWLASVFIHGTTRPIDGIGDPHWHAHVVAANCAWDPQEKRLKALEMETIYAKRAYYQAWFHTRCAELGLQYGYGYRRTGDGLVLSAVSPELKDVFCRRTQEIEALEIKTRRTLERKASAIVSEAARSGKFLDQKQVYAQLKDHLGEQIRRGKDETRMEGAALEAEWIKRAGEGVLERVWQTARNGERIGFLDEAKAKELAIRHAFQDECVIRDVDLFVAISTWGAGTMSLAEMERFCESDPRLARNPAKPGFVTTWEIAREEQAIREVVRDGEGRYQPLSTAPQMDKTLDARQQAALQLIISSVDMAVAVPGYPGSGKSRLVQKAAESIKDLTGEDVIILAPTGRAAFGLARDAGVKDAYTIAKFRASEKLQCSATGRYVFCDEFSLAGNKDVKWLLDYCHREGKQIAFFGDSKQYQGVARGTPVSDLLNAGLIKFEQLTNIYRQTNPELLAAARDVAEGRIIESCDRIQSAGWLHSYETDSELRRNMVEEMSAVVRKGQRVLAIAHEHANGREISYMLRSRLKELGLLGEEDIQVKTLMDVNMTEAQRADARNHGDGYVYKFFQLAKGGFKPGEEWNFHHIDGETVIGERFGVQKVLPLDSESFGVYSAGEMPMAVGDQILATRNDPSLGVSTGDTMKVAAIDRGIVTLDNGRRVDAGKGIHFRQAWTVTGEAAQGDQEIMPFVYMPTSESGQFNVRQWTTDITRSKEKVWVGTDCVEVVRAGIVRLADPESALSLLQGVEKDQKPIRVDLQELARKPAKSIDPYMHDQDWKHNIPDRSIEPPDHEMER